MAEYRASILWQRASDEQYTDRKYSRAHQWQFDGGATIEASSSPHIVPLPYSSAEGVDPEEAFIASLSSCHMLFFLDFAAKAGWVVDSYTDHAIGVMDKDHMGMMSMSEVTLRPKVVFSTAKEPCVEQLEQLHHQAHQHCFIANSVKTEVTTDMVL
ncbi:OsmC family protein [Psychrobium sp. 1_MG-2023]|uniref:OsmC family protein n=1 Tax=Psychrobium sp. 1_MG-2023 TaxID=3062624 RepID=UPI0027329D41|nr:OsmC family protein [Psychrobium sp. 1_MG-2023]MDP2559743.1 OsmC family protein [Psychrobium sp. 1_MG-2023]